MVISIFEELAASLTQYASFWRVGALSAHFSGLPVVSLSHDERRAFAQLGMTRQELTDFFSKAQGADTKEENGHEGEYA